MSKIRQRITHYRSAASPAGAGASLVTAPNGLPRVDKEKGIIFGASAMQAVEALGHDTIVDHTTLAQLRDFGNAAPGGIKVRFTHPGLCADGMGKMLGRQTNFRIVDDKVVGDIHLNDSSAKSPEGDLRSYVLDLAAEDPASFGMSVVISMHGVWKLADGTEIPANDPSLRRGHGKDAYFDKPATATTSLPLCRIDELHACDVVDEPAANRAGLFAAAFSGTTSFDAEQAFAFLDQARASLGLKAADLTTFLSRYLTARDLAGTTAPRGKDHTMQLTPERLAQLCELHAIHSPTIVKLAAANKTDADILTEVASLDASAAKTALEAKVVVAETALANKEAAHAVALKAETDKVTALTAQLAALQVQHAAVSKLGANTPADVGGSPTTSASEKDPLAEGNLKLSWEANPKLRESFGGDFTALVALAKHDKPLAIEALGIKA